MGVLSLTGCASITTDSMQYVAVSAKTSQGEALSQVDCSLSNEKGLWTVKAPNKVSIHKAAGDLTVACNKEGQPEGQLTAISRAGAGMYGNILIGGGIGALIDHNTGKAYNYPSNLPVVMGESKIIDPDKSTNFTPEESSEIVP